MKLICYLSNTINTAPEMATHYLEAGCDIIEVDLPAKDPYLDSPLIQTMMKRTLKECSDYEQYLAQIALIKSEHPVANIIIVAYESTIREIGYERFIEFCHQHQILDLIFVGMKDERGKDVLIAAGIRVSCYVQFNMQKEEIIAAKNSNGFVYLQAKPTADRINPKYPTLKACIESLRSEHLISRPIYCGVGIHTTDDAKKAKEAGADGVFVGSGILRLYHDVQQLKETIKAFKESCR
jgi:tryptophan synthase alpha chain